jgi:CheY-like chemotaxis protein
MSDKHSVLIVDSNVAFATILEESLEQDGNYDTTVAGSAAEALQAMTAADFELAIVDMGLSDQDGATLARSLRQQKADLRLMLIPLQGDELPSEAADLEVQGVLPKPFFFPELPGRVASALGMVAEEEVQAPDPAPVEAVAPPVVDVAPAAPPPAVSSEDKLASLREHIQEIVLEMKVLSQEISAEAVILTCAGKLFAHTGRLSAEEADRLAQVADESWRTSARVAEILGREQLRFEQSVEGGEHLFYSLAVAEGIILSVALRASAPLGMIRHRAKATADALDRLISKG